MVALKLLMMGVLFVALLGASPSTVEARTHIPSILTTSESLEDIVLDLDTVRVSDSSLDGKVISEVRSALDSLGINKGIMAGPPCNCGRKDCCDFEVCIRSRCHQQCSCMDVGECCHAACQNCNCTQTLPPQCRCMDSTPYNHGKCTV